MYISTSSYPFSSSIVPIMGSFRWRYNASNRVVFIGVLARYLLAHRHISARSY